MSENNTIDTFYVNSRLSTVADYYSNIAFGHLDDDLQHIRHYGTDPQLIKISFGQKVYEALMKYKDHLPENVKFGGYVMSKDLYLKLGFQQYLAKFMNNTQAELLRLDTKTRLPDSPSIPYGIPTADKFLEVQIDIKNPNPYSLVALFAAALIDNSKKIGRLGILLDTNSMVKHPEVAKYVEIFSKQYSIDQANNRLQDR